MEVEGTGRRSGQPLKRHVAEFAERMDELEKQWQNAGSAKDYFDLLRTLAPLHRTPGTCTLACKKPASWFPKTAT